MLTTGLITNINQSNVRHDSQDINWINSDNTTKMNKDLNKTWDDNHLKRKKISNSESRQKSNTGPKYDCILSCSYPVT